MKQEDKQFDDYYWLDLRNHAAISFMQVMITEGSYAPAEAKKAVACANALVKELKKGSHVVNGGAVL